MCYQIGFCFWLLSFEQEIAEQLNKSVMLFPHSAPFLRMYAGNMTSYPSSRTSPKRRSRRKSYVLSSQHLGWVAKRTCRITDPEHLSRQNLVAKAPSANLPAMLVAQLLPFVKNLSTRKWTDEDIPEDVQYLRDELNARFESLTYANEYTDVSSTDNGHTGHTTTTHLNLPLVICPGHQSMSPNCSGKRTRQSSTTKITNSSSMLSSTVHTLHTNHSSLGSSFVYSKSRTTQSCFRWQPMMWAST